LCVAFGAFITSSLPFLKEIGVGIALAVAIDATIVRCVLVPALMKLLGEWNWWAPGPLRRGHERIFGPGAERAEAGERPAGGRARESVGSARSERHPLRHSRLASRPRGQANAR
jgi:uncharacterized membrane protein YdfJ with MMPL/SSD domain